MVAIAKALARKLLPFELRQELRRRRYVRGRRGRRLWYFAARSSVWKAFLEEKVGERVGYRMNIAEPTTFSEKVQWRKLYDRRSLLPQLADKVSARAYVEALEIPDLYLPELLFESSQPSQIPFDSLEPPSVIKANNGCGGHWFIRDRSELDRDAVISDMNGKLRTWYGRESLQWVYGQITPKVMVERMLLTDDDQVPPDFKFYVFDGKVRLILVSLDRSTQLKQVFLDRDWNRLELRKQYPIAESVDIPSESDTMRHIAEKLGEGLDFARTDLYLCNGTVYFGEFTLYPSDGKAPFNPVSYDSWLGKQWKLPSVSGRA